MKKNLINSICLLLLANASLAAADTWTAPLKIESLQTTRIQADSVIRIAGMCVDNFYAYMGPNEANHNAVLSIALAAMSSNKKVKLLCSDSCASTSRCRVLDIEVSN